MAEAGAICSCMAVAVPAEVEHNCLANYMLGMLEHFSFYYRRFICSVISTAGRDPSMKYNQEMVGEAHH